MAKRVNFWRFDGLLQVLTAALFSALLGCSGFLVIEQQEGVGSPCESSAACGIGLVCDDGKCVPSDGSCSAELTHGHCPRGRVCVSGACICDDLEQCGCPAGGCSVSETWCECTPEQGCIVGACVEVHEDNACSPTNINGACINDEVCAGGFCVPVQAGVNNCSAERPTGLCAAGLSCVGGFCIPTSDNPCDTGNANGYCAAGQQCQTSTQSNQSSCVVVACGPEQPFGTCALDQFCNNGVCEDLPCSPGHTNSACDSGEFCSAIGSCIPDDTCKVSDDCDGTGIYCSVAEICRLPGSCGVDEDCGERQPVYGQGWECGPTEFCEERTECLTALDCLPEKFCSAEGLCLTPGACDTNLDCGANTFCSGIGQCIDDGSCRVGADCGSGFNCSTGQVCIAADTCITTADCPPGTACDSSVCIVSGQTCNSNNFGTESCGADELTCCQSGSCCPGGQICSDMGSCITQMQCTNDADCPPGDYSCVDYQCQPTVNCIDQNGANCLGGEYCSFTGGCVPTGVCTSNFDCQVGERCNAEWKCEPAPACGVERLSSGALVQPNIFIVLDRSGSMNLCGPGDAAVSGLRLCGGYNDAFDCCEPTNTCEHNNECSSNVCHAEGLCSVGACHGGVPDYDTRWDQAVDVINQVTLQQQARVRFGLSTYPQQCANTNPCTLQCNWITCTFDCDGDGVSNGRAGVVNNALPASRQDILNTLAATFPGGATPTGPTLRNLTENLSSTGLAGSERPSFADPSRQNAILLVTDGEANSDEVSSVRVCEPPCTDGIQNGGETAVDCGGPCAPCGHGLGCNTNNDCLSGFCQGSVCRPATCDDGIQNGAETGVDCGGLCLPCASGGVCSGASDCQSGICDNDICAASACDDGLKNGTETAEDCGGDCDPCATGLGCSVNGDCQSGVCQAGQCRVAACAGSCGGACEPCENGGGCTTNADCQSGFCSGASICAVGQCDNGVKDGDEVDVDCGGSTCEPCAGGFVCTNNSDCLSNECSLCSGDASADAACKVNAALDGLYARDIKTYVVGFALEGGVSPNLNCNAYHGRTARRDECGIVDGTSCADAAGACYYEADDAATLSAAFESIIDQVVSCSYTLTAYPSDPNRLFVYLDRDGEPDLQRVERYFAWDYNFNLNQVDFYGSVCDAIRNGTAEPVVVDGCPGGGG